LEKCVNELGNACSGFNDEDIQELREIARIYSEASGIVIKLSGIIGDQAKTLLDKVPEDWQGKIDAAADMALRSSYAAAAATQADQGSDTLLNRLLGSASGERWHMISTDIAGAIGGAGGLLTTGIDIMATTTLILRSVQQIAAEYGEDIENEEVRLQCLAVFGFGGPLTEDDEIETGLFATRAALTGATLAEMIKHVLPRFGINLAPKTLAQVTPLIGAAAGATINPIFVSYYQQMAHVHFRLRKFERGHDGEQVKACFERVMKARKELKKAREAR
jgi:EcsC protein family